MVEKGPNGNQAGRCRATSSVVDTGGALRSVPRSMSSSASSGAASPAPPAPRAPAAPAAPALHARSFKLRFATQHELGRSDVSAVKPLGLPAVVSAKFYRREPSGEVEEPRAERALRRVSRMFRAGPRDALAAPLTSAHEYGWWWEHVTQLEGDSRQDPRLQHHLCDSAWLKERLRVLATDNGLKRR